jgi:putative ABC transport system permease protein
MSGRALRTGGRTRDHVATVLVAGVSSLFGVALVEAVVLISGAVGASAASSSGTVAIALGTVSAVFLLIAVYVAAVVTANTFATIVAGRRRPIALLRLLGAPSARVRRALSVEGLVVGAIGAAGGLVLGVTVAAIVAGIGLAQGWLPPTAYALLTPALAGPVVVVIATTWLAAWIGCRSVTLVSPLEATAVAADPASSTVRRARSATVAIVLLVLGVAFLALGVLSGMLSPVGLLVAFFGGVFSFSGIIAGARFIMPAVLRLVGRTFGHSPSARIAVANASRYPERSTRATMSLIIGVTLVTMFAVALTTYSDVVTAQLAESAGERQALGSTIALTIGVFSVLVGFSALIAAVGLVNTLTVGMLQRIRELGLLRALGFSRGQLRAMILAEGAQLTAGAVVFGLLLGILYGWVAAQSLLGAVVHGIVSPAVPWPIVVVVIGGGAMLTAVSCVIASRRASAVSPVVALAVE